MRKRNRYRRVYRPLQLFALKDAIKPRPFVSDQNLPGFYALPIIAAAINDRPVNQLLLI